LRPFPRKHFIRRSKRRRTQVNGKVPEPEVIDIDLSSDDEEVKGGPEAEAKGNEQEQGKDVQSRKNFLRIREYFGENFSYSLDAKSRGNIGRFFNHSCSPNVFVQNIFVDTHDLRFPWVGFFAAENIRAFEELTWDYNYEVGSVPGKSLECFCGSDNCKGRLI
jgi:histone-lysine N-methyltransferase SETDB1